MVMILTMILTLVLVDLTLLTQKEYNRSAFIVIAFVVFAILAGTRSIDLGTDTPFYVEKYWRLEHLTFKDMWDDIFNPLLKDPAFYFFSKIFSYLGFTAEGWLALLSAIFLLSYSFLVYRFSPYPLLSFLFLISVGLFYFSFSGLRQTLAMSLTILSIPFLLERRFVAAGIIILLSSFFHKSSLVFAALIPFAYIPIHKYAVLLITSAVAASLVLSNALLDLISAINLANYSAYVEDASSLNWSGFLIQLLMFAFAYLYVNKANDVVAFFLNLALIGVALQAMSVVVAEFFRLSLYFSVAFAVLIPLAISNIGIKSHRAGAFVSVVIAFIAYLLYSGQFEDF